MMPICLTSMAAVASASTTAQPLRADGYGSITAAGNEQDSWYPNFQWDPKTNNFECKCHNVSDKFPGWKTGMESEAVCLENFEGRQTGANKIGGNQTCCIKPDNCEEYVQSPGGHCISRNNKRYITCNKCADGYKLAIDGHECLKDNDTASGYGSGSAVEGHHRSLNRDESGSATAVGKTDQYYPKFEWNTNLKGFFCQCHKVEWFTGMPTNESCLANFMGKVAKVDNVIIDQQTCAPACTDKNGNVLPFPDNCQRPGACVFGQGHGVSATCEICEDGYDLVNKQDTSICQKASA